MSDYLFLSLLRVNHLVEHFNLRLNNRNNLLCWLYVRDTAIPVLNCTLLMDSSRKLVFKFAVGFHFLYGRSPGLLFFHSKNSLLHPLLATSKRYPTCLFFFFLKLIINLAFCSLFITHKLRYLIHLYHYNSYCNL